MATRSGSWSNSVMSHVGGKRIGLLALFALAGALGCSGSGDEELTTNQGGPSGNMGGPAGGGSGAQLPSDEVPTDLGGGTAGAGGAVSGVLDESNACLSEVREAERVSVDLFVMLDRSGSMLNYTGDITAEVTKWDAVTGALSQFLENPETAQIGVGLRVFPQLNQGIPEACFTNEECGTFGPCSVPGLCPDGAFCTSDTGCVHPNDPTATGFCGEDPSSACTAGTICTRGRGPCIPLKCTDGFCANDPNYVCLIGGNCIDEFGVDLGECLPLGGYCLAGDTCEAPSYAVPDVPITLGAERNPPLLAALQNIEPTGFTPTTPALEGAIDYAQSWSQSHPDRVAAVVLATDGFPSECTDLTQDPVAPVLSVAQAGVTDAVPVRTYVVGVFSEEESVNGAAAILDAIAVSGNTEHAYLVSTDGNVSQDFLTALQAISSSAIACEFLLPADDDLDYNSVNLLLTRADATELQLVNVGSVEGCAQGNDSGWYYVNDATTGVPSQISVCPGVCQTFAQISGGKVDLQIGCETILR